MSKEILNYQPYILIVEDEIKIRKLLKKFFKKENFNVVMAKDGTEAVKKAELQKFDLIVTDIKMPRMTGDKAIDLIKMMNNLNNKDTPIFVISGFFTEDLVLGKLKGNISKAYVKPFRFEELVEDAIKLIAERDSY